MAGKRIQTELVVKATDQFSAKVRTMSGVTGRFANKVRADLGGLQKLRGPLNLIKDFKTAQSTFGKSEAALRQSRQRLTEIRAEMRATSAPTKKMTQDFDRAQRAAERLRLSHQKNKNELVQLQGKLRSAGVNTGDLAGEQSRLSGVLNKANGAFARQADRMQRLKVMQDRVTAGRERMDRSLARAANLSFVGNASMQTGRRMLTGLSKPIMQAVEFESAMSDVRKVVDFESPAAFKVMSEDILELSTRIPMAASGLAEIVAAGGQSGIAKVDLTKFAEMAAKIGVAFDISAGQSGDSMANIKTALSLTIDETGLLFDAMNHLSNNMASTAPKVLDFMNRTGAAGIGFGFDPTEAMAIGSAMIAAGAQSDVAATSFRKVGGTLVKGAAATAGQRRAFKALGLDAKEVAKNMQIDAKGTMMDVFERLQDLPAHVRASTMTQLFGEEARAITPLLGNLDLLREALGLVSDERDFAGSADAEYAERAKTTANNLQLTRNQMTRLGVSIGEMVLPPLNDLLAKSQKFIDKLVVWTKENPKLTKGLVTGGLALGAMAVAGGFLLTAAAGIIGTMAVMRFGLVGLAARAAFAGGGLASLAGGFGRLGRAKRFRLSSLISPVRWSSGLIPPIVWSKLIKPLLWIGRGAVRFVPVIGWALLAGELSWHFLIKPLGWDEYLPTVDWSKFMGAFSWESGIPVIDWSQFVSSISWSDKVTNLTWSGFIKSVDWKSYIARVSPVAFVASFAWKNVIRNLQWKDYIPGKAFDWRGYVSDLNWGGFVPRVIWRNFLSHLPWDTFIPDINWAKWFSFSWTDFLPAWSWDFITAIDLSGLISWPAPPAWLKWLMNGSGDESKSSGAKGALQTRASGGPFGESPLLVGERGPELYFPNRSGFIATNEQTRGLQKGAQRVRSAGLAALATSALVGSATGAAAGDAAGGGSAVSKVTSARVEIGSIHITAPSGVSDPEGLVDLIETRLGDRVSATFAASFSD